MLKNYIPYNAFFFVFFSSSQWPLLEREEKRARDNNLFPLFLLFLFSSLLPSFTTYSIRRLLCISTDGILDHLLQVLSSSSSLFLSRFLLLSPPGKWSWEFWPRRVALATSATSHDGHNLYINWRRGSKEISGVTKRSLAREVSFLLLFPPLPSPSPS